MCIEFNATGWVSELQELANLSKDKCGHYSFPKDCLQITFEHHVDTITTPPRHQLGRHFGTMWVPKWHPKAPVGGTIWGAIWHHTGVTMAPLRETMGTTWVPKQRAKAPFRGTIWVPQRQPLEAPYGCHNNTHQRHHLGRHLGTTRVPSEDKDLAPYLVPDGTIYFNSVYTNKVLKWSD